MLANYKEHQVKIVYELSHRTVSYLKRCIGLEGIIFSSDVSICLYSHTVYSNAWSFCFMLALCLFARCPVNGLCVRKEDGTTTCKCPDLKSCPLEYKRVCGTNGKTYKNACHMKVDECLQNDVIGIAKRGSCGKLSPKNIYFIFVYS